MKRLGTLLLDLAAGPIPVRELRSTFRGWRFVILFTASLAVALFILLSTAFAMEQDSQSSSTIGQAIFAVLAAIQAALIGLLVPGFAGTSIVRERDKSTLELLSTTTIQPWQIVWGQLMASMGYVAVYLFATLPLMALPFWYGGLSGWEPVVAYAILFILAALIAMWGIYASATSQSIARATGMSYVFPFLLGLPLSAFIVNTLERAMRGRDDLSEVIKAVSVHAGYVALDGVYGFAAPFTFLFICAVNRLKPWGSNRSTALRVFAVLFLPAAAMVLLLNFHHFNDPLDHDERTTSAYSWWFFIASTGTLMAFFAAEGAIEGKRLFKQLDRLRGGLAPLRLFMPGGRRGYILTMLAITAAVAIGGPVVMRVMAWDAPDRVDALLLTSGTVLAQVFFACGVTLWLGALRIPTGAARALAAFTLAAVPIGSVVWQYAAYGGYPISDHLQWNSPGYLCFPWILSKVWTGTTVARLGIPEVGLRHTAVWVPFWIFHFGGGFVMAVTGAIAERIRERENRAAMESTGRPAKAAPPVSVPAGTPA